MRECENIGREYLIKELFTIMKIEKIINASKKFLGTSLLVGALTVNPFLTKNIQAQSPKLSFSRDLIIKYESGLIKNIKNIPLEVRTLPRESDGRYMVTIKEDNVELHRRILLGTKLGGRISFGENVGLILGMNFDFDFGSKKENMHTRDYNERKKSLRNNPSLACESKPQSGPSTYYRIYSAFLHDRNNFFKPSIYSEIEARITKNFGLGLGYELSKEKLVVDNGWESSDELKSSKRYNLADLTIKNIYGSFKFNNQEDDVFYSLDLGLSSVIKNDLTPIGKQTEINFNDKNWFVGFRMGKKF